MATHIVNQRARLWNTGNRKSGTRYLGVSSPLPRTSELANDKRLQHPNNKQDENQGDDLIWMVSSKNTKGKETVHTKEPVSFADAKALFNKIGEDAA